MKSAQSPWFKPDEGLTFSLDTGSCGRGNYYKGKSHYNYQNEGIGQVSSAVLVGDWTLYPEPPGWLALTQPQVQKAECCYHQVLTSERWGRLAPCCDKPWPDLPPVQIGCAPTFLPWGHPGFLISRAVQAAQLVHLVPTWNGHRAKTWIQAEETGSHPGAASKRGFSLKEFAELTTEIFPMLISTIIRLFPMVSLTLCVLAVHFFWFYLKEDFISSKNKLYL